MTLYSVQPNVYSNILLNSSIETLSAVANSYRATDSWMYSPAMSEDAFTRLQDIIEAAGELSARVEFGSLVDNSFADKVMGVGE